MISAHYCVSIHPSIHSSIHPLIRPSIRQSIHLRRYSPLLDLGRFFRFLIFYTVGRTSWTGNQPVARPLPARRIAQTQNKGTQTSMHRVEIEPTIPVFERVKTVHALDCAPRWSAAHYYTELFYNFKMVLLFHYPSEFSSHPSHHYSRRSRWNRIHLHWIVLCSWVQG
jgi:hypothetical protein